MRLPLAARVRTLVSRLLDAEECTSEGIAVLLGMHTRTLQRCLRAEGQSFEAVKDSVRRDVALRYLGEPDMTLTRVAERLGYSEGSVLSRCCNRWFAASPREMRDALTDGRGYRGGGTIPSPRPRDQSLPVGRRAG